MTNTAFFSLMGVLCLVVAWAVHGLISLRRKVEKRLDREKVLNEKWRDFLRRREAESRADMVASARNPEFKIEPGLQVQLAQVAPEHWFENNYRLGGRSQRKFPKAFTRKQLELALRSEKKRGGLSAALRRELFMHYGVIFPPDDLASKDDVFDPKMSTATQFVLKTK